MRQGKARKEEAVTRRPSLKMLASLVAAAVLATVLVLAQGNGATLFNAVQGTAWIRTLKSLFHINGSAQAADGRPLPPISAFAAGGLYQREGSQAFVLDGNTLRSLDGATLSFGQSIDLKGPGNIVAQGGGMTFVITPSGSAWRIEDDQRIVKISLGGRIRQAVVDSNGVLWALSDQPAKVIELDGSTKTTHVLPAGSPVLFVSNDNTYVLDQAHGTISELTHKGVRQVATGPAAEVLTPTETSSGVAPFVRTDAQALIIWRLGGPASAQPLNLVGHKLSPAFTFADRIYLPDLTDGSLRVFDSLGKPLPKYDVTNLGADFEVVRREGYLFISTSHIEQAWVVDGRDGKKQDVTLHPTGLENKKNNTPPIKPKGKSKKQKPTTAKPVPPSKPGAPDHVLASAGYEVVDLAWSPSTPNGSAITRYEIGWTENDKDMSTSLLTTPDTKMKLGSAQGITNGNHYVFRVRAVNGVGPGEFGYSTRVTPSNIVPAAPGNVTAKTDKPDQGNMIQVKWDKADPQGDNKVDAYDIIAKDETDTTAPPIHKNIPVRPGTDIYSDSLTGAGGDGIRPADKYCISVRAHSMAFGPESPCIELIAFTQASAVKSFKALFGPNDDVTLNWGEVFDNDLNGGQFSSFLITEKPANGPSTDLPPPSGGMKATTYGPISLNPNTFYTFTIVILTSTPPGNPSTDPGPFKGDSSTDAGTACAAPTASLSASASGNTVTASFNVNDPNSGPVQCQLYINNSPTGNGCQSPYTITGLNYSTTYSLRVYVSNTCQGSSGNDSNVATVTTGPPPPPPPSIVVSKGSGPYHPTGCSVASCAHVHVTFANFGANQKLTMTFWTDNCNGSGAWGIYTITTNGSGAWSGDTPYAFGCSGWHVWVTAGGYESNHYTWP
jgi:hypothetical protein